MEKLLAKTRLLGMRAVARQRLSAMMKRIARYATTVILPLLLVLPAFLLPGWAETLPVGTEITIRLEQTIQPADSKIKNSDKFSAPLAFPVFADGHEVLPAGSKIEGEIRGSKKSIFLSPRRAVLPNGRKIDLTATVSAVNQKHLKAGEKEGTIEKKGTDKGEIAQQAGEIGSTGAVIGALSTWSMKGMGIGAAAGVGAVLIGHTIAGRGKTAVIPAGSQVTLSLNQPIDVPDDAVDAKAPDDQNRNTDDSDSRPILRRSE